MDTERIAYQQGGKNKSMSEIELKCAVQKYLEVEQEIEERQVELASLKNSIKAAMEERNVDELCVGEWVVRSKTVLTSIFDKTRFKLKYEELYNSFLKQVESKKFSIS